MQLALPFRLCSAGVAYACVGIEEVDRICKLECGVNSESFVIPATKQSLLSVEAHDDVILVLEGAPVVAEDNRLFPGACVAKSFARVAAALL